MGNRQFVIDMANAVAWPLVVGLGVWLLRSDLRGLLGRVKSLKGAGVSLEFERDTERVLAEAQSAALGTSGQDVPEAASPGAIRAADLARPAEASPEHIVLSSWELVVAAIRDVAGLAGLDLNRGSPAVLIRQLGKSGIIADEDVEAINDLRLLRNRAAHGEPVPRDSAESYAEAVDLVRSKLLHPTTLKAARLRHPDHE